MIVGRGKIVILSADEICMAIDAFIVAHGVYVGGARTIRLANMCAKSGPIEEGETGLFEGYEVHVTCEGPCHVNDVVEIEERR